MEKKVVVVGSGGVGKSSITIQFIQGTFTAQYDPTIEDSYRKQIEVDGNHFMLDILDTAGQEEYSSMRASYMRGGQGFILVYSVTSESSLKDTESIHQTMCRVKNTEKVPMVLVGNKCDLDNDREVTEENGRKLSTKFECPFFETSAKQNINIQEVFLATAREILKSEVKNESATVTKVTKKGSSGCVLL